MPAFTTIAAAAGLAASAAGTIMSFSDASKQKELQGKAEAAAQKAIEEAKRKLDVNFYAGLSIQKEPYNLEREAMAAAGAQSIAAAAESERGVEGTAGRIQLAQQLGERQIAAAEGKEMSNLETLTAAEASRLNGEKVKIDEYEAIGAQQAAKDAQSARAKDIAQGFAGIQSMATQLGQMAPLYPKTTPTSKTTPGTSQAGGSLNSMMSLGGQSGGEFGMMAPGSGNLSAMFAGLDPAALAALGL